MPVMEKEREAQTPPAVEAPAPRAVPREDPMTDALTTVPAQAPAPPVDEVPPSQVVYIQQHPEKKGSGLGISGFILGVVGTMMGMVPLLAVPALTLGAIGLGLGAGQAYRAKKYKAGRVWALVAVLTSVLSVVLAFIGFNIVLG